MTHWTTSSNSFMVISQLYAWGVQPEPRGLLPSYPKALARDAALPRATMMRHRAPCARATVPTSRANLLWYQLRFGYKLLFSVHQHLEMKISTLIECILAEEDREGLPRLLGHLSLNVCVTYTTPQNTCICLHTYTQTSEVINRNEASPQNFPHIYLVLIWDIPVCRKHVFM